MKIMVSACLAGENCKYNGGNNRNEKVLQLMAGNEVITVCPEQMGGLPTPRVPAEIRNGIVTAKDGKNVDAEFRTGAARCLEIAVREKPDLIILQSRSPSCGVKQRYDGTFSGKLTEGAGVTAQLLMENGFRVIDAEDLMKEKVIFLDVDGVLNNSKTTARSPNGYVGVSNDLIRNLRKIVDQTGAKLVLSSDWRLIRDDPYKGKDYRYLLQKLRFIGNLKMWDHTIDINWNKRGIEIMEYLDEHPEITEFVILDDIPFSDFFNSRLKDHFIQTNPRYGLTEEDVKRAVRILDGID